MTESKKRRVHPPEFKAKVGLEASLVQIRIIGALVVAFSSQLLSLIIIVAIVVPHQTLCQCVHFENFKN